MQKMSANYILLDSQKKAIDELEKYLEKKFTAVKIIIFGSVARQEADDESDLDLLILIQEKATHKVRNIISDKVFDINLKYDTNISIVVIEHKNWENGIIKMTPFYKEVQRDGVPV